MSQKVKDLQLISSKQGNDIKEFKKIISMKETSELKKIDEIAELKKELRNLKNSHKKEIDSIKL
jgi:hypothetical protein